MYNSRNAPVLNIIKFIVKTSHINDERVMNIRAFRIQNHTNVVQSLCHHLLQFLIFTVYMAQVGRKCFLFNFLLVH